jgi:hypothetical protein
VSTVALALAEAMRSFVFFVLRRGFVKKRAE